MDKRKILITVLLGAFALIANAQTEKHATITGSIKTVDGTPAEFINILIDGTGLGAATDGDGTFRIDNVPYGKCKLLVSHIGLETKKVDIEVDNSTIALDEIILTETDRQLEDIVVTGSRINKFSEKESDYVARMPMKNLENPQVYSVITSELLDELQTTDIQSSLQNAPSISNIMQGIGSGGVGLNLYLRGFSADIAMRNGVATAFRTGTDPSNLERIEVIKGPSGTLFGTSLVSSYGGVINRVTKKPYDNFGGSVGYSTGSFKLSRATIDINAPLNEKKTVLFRINSARHNEHSFQDYGLTRNWFVAPSLTYKANDRLTLNIEAEIYKNQSPGTYFNPGNAGLSSMDNLNYNFDSSYGSDYLYFLSKSSSVFAEARYEISDQWTSQTVLSTSNVDNTTDYLFLDFFDANDAVRRIMRIESQFYVIDVQQNLVGQFDIGSVKNKLLVGLDYNDTQTPYRRTQINYDTIGFSNLQGDFNPEAYYNMLGQTSAFRIGTRDQASLGIYASDVIAINSRLSMMASLRFDHFNDREQDYTQSYLAPKFGAIYQVVKDQVSVFANYMSGFKNVAPDLSSGEKVELKPEFAAQMEGGVKTELLNRRLYATVSYYDITVNNAVRYTNINGVRSQIQDGVKSSKGFEVELAGNPIRGWNIVAGYGYNESEFVEGDESVLGNAPYATPKNTFNLWTSYKLTSGLAQGLGIGFGVNSIGDSYVDDTNTLLSPGYTIYNASIFYERPVIRLGLKFNNLTDEEYWANMGSYVQPQKSRNAVVSIIYKF